MNRIVLFSVFVLAIAGCGRMPHDPDAEDRLPPEARPADPARGQEVAVRWCSACHVVMPGVAPLPDQVRAPTFAGLATDPSKDDTFLRRFMDEVHPPMPTYRLFPEEKVDLIAYLASLRPRR